MAEKQKRVTGLHANSLAGRMSEFFKNNPGEELTFEDVMTKFDVSRGHVHNAVLSLNKHGMKVSVQQIVRLEGRAS
ncbi:MAG: hypothetical protein KA784_00190 [Aquabacterium sp.]|nr:hypothetical protein [Aquabacterium sp.]